MEGGREGAREEEEESERERKGGREGGRERKRESKAERRREGDKEREKEGGNGASINIIHVLYAENEATKLPLSPVTHGCIIASIRLYVNDTELPG